MTQTSAPSNDDPEIHPFLYSALRKIERAKNTLINVYPHIEKFKIDNPSRVVVETVGTLDYVKIISPETPVDLALILGDVVHCMSGAMDHLATGVVAAFNGGVFDDRVYYPVRKSEAGFKSLESGKDLHEIYRLAPQVWQIIKKEMPWMDNPIGRLFWHIRQLHNIDKHRLLVYAPYKSITVPELITPNFNMRSIGNLYEFNGWGEFTIFVAPSPVIIARSNIDYDFYLIEPDIGISSPLFDFFAAAYGQIRRIVEEVNTELMQDPISRSLA